MPTTEKSPEFYKHYPALFHTYFPIVSAETLRLLCKAGYTYYNAVLCVEVVANFLYALYLYDPKVYLSVI